MQISPSELLIQSAASQCRKNFYSSHPNTDIENKPNESHAKLPSFLCSP